jgi:hypothetical protein
VSKEDAAEAGFAKRATVLGIAIVARALAAILSLQIRLVRDGPFATCDAQRHASTRRDMNASDNGTRCFTKFPEPRMMES